MNRFFPILALAGLWFPFSASHSADGTWTGASSSVWTASGNWSGGIPGDTGTGSVNVDTATFVSSGAGNLTIDVASRNVGSLVFNDQASSNVAINVGPAGNSLRFMQNITIDSGSMGSHSITGAGLLRLGAANQDAGVYNYSINNQSTKLFTISVATLDASGGGTGPKTRNLTFGGAGDVLITANINSTDIQLIKSGLGTLTLAKSSGSSYGSTSVDGGTLLVTNTSGSATGSGAVTIKNSGTLGGSGLITPTGGNQILVESGGALLAGNGVDASGALTIHGNLTLNSGSTIKMVLGPGGAHSTLTRSLTTSTWSFASGQAFEFTLINGATATTYDNLITGITADPGVSSWTISSPGITGSFVWDGANIDLVVSAIPEPSMGLLLGLGLTAVGLLRRRRMTVRG